VSAVLTCAHLIRRRVAL